MPLTERELTWFLKNTCLNKSEIEERANEFYSIASHRSKITKEDLINQIDDNSGDKELARLLTNAMDVNGDNRIDLREYMLFSSFVKTNNPREQFTFLFRVFDLNGDGRITVPEFRKALDIVQQFGLISVAEMNNKYNDQLKTAFFRQLDKDGNGWLSQQEFVDGFIQLTKKK